MAFNKPCMKCGKLSRQATCQECHLTSERARDKIRDHDPQRKLKKATLYNSQYKKHRNILIAGGGICYLCGGVVPPGTGQADHLIASNPQSPLAITHAFCNQSRGNKTIQGG